MLHLPSSLLPKTKGPQTKKLQVHKLRDPREKYNLQVMLEERLHCVTAAQPEEQWKQMKTILQETTAELLAYRPENTKTGSMKQIRKSKSCSKRNAPATIICLQNLMIKLPRLRTRLPAVHSKLSLAPCRMIAGQDLSRGHNGMLTWVTCAFNEALKAVFGPSHQIQAPLSSSDGSAPLTYKEAILLRWSEHFEGRFSDRRTV